MCTQTQSTYNVYTDTKHVYHCVHKHKGRIIMCTQTQRTYTNVYTNTKEEYKCVHTNTKDV